MPQWRVRDVMTTEVITAPDDAPFAQLAAVLAAHRISAVAITDRFDAVVGVVSWTDLIDQVDVGEPNSTGRWSAHRAHRSQDDRDHRRAVVRGGRGRHRRHRPAGVRRRRHATDHRAATRDSHPLRGWWTEHRLRRQVPSAAAGLDGHDSRRTHADACDRIGGPAMIRPPTRPPLTRMTAHGDRVDLLRRTSDAHPQPPDVSAGDGGFNDDIVDEWGRQSFPASDPPANW